METTARGETVNGETLGGERLERLPWDRHGLRGLNVLLEPSNLRK